MSSLEMTDHEMASVILPNLDYEAQLIAISGLLARNHEADERLEARMKSFEEYARKSAGLSNERAVDLWGEYFYTSVYQSAAHSMAALGMIAPFFESMFFQAFHGIRRRYFEPNVIMHGARRLGINDPEQFWDCHCYYDRRKRKCKDNLVFGILQLSEAVELQPFLPNNLQSTLAALFSYRNQMFHNGFEWQQTRCDNFSARIVKSGWQEWFSASTRGDKPWIFYMTDKFIEHSLETAQKVLESFGRYAKNRDSKDAIQGR